MASMDKSAQPLWAEAKAKKKIDVLREVARVLQETERVHASQPIAEMTEANLESEQLRLEDMLHARSITVDEFRRLKEIDFYLDGMRERRQYIWTPDGWEPDALED